jgi:peptide/nickel transport system substrate-binding protein
MSTHSGGSPGSWEEIMTTRRQVLGYASAFAAVAAPTSEALAQAVSAAGSNFNASGLVGTLEGPTQVDTIPTSFKEAPALAELVRQGKLPPVAQRLPSEPMVLKPLQSIGRYGGTWRRGFIGPSDGENGNRLNSSDKLLFWDATGSKIVPSVAKRYEMSADGKTTTLFLRKGMKWSDGTPFTADAFVFWYEDLYSNKDIVPVPIANMAPMGKPGRLVKIDETTVQFQFDVPYFLFLSLLAGDTQIGGGQSIQQSIGQSFGAYTPGHYLKQFLPKYSSEAEVNRRAREMGYENWGRALAVKKDWELNPDLPTIGPWHTVKPINTPTWTMERNPYYWVVDTEGNQLPYIDNVVMTLAEDLEVVNLRAMAGEYDLQERHIDLQKLPLILDNRDRGNYDVHLDLAYNGADTAIQINLSYVADPEVAKWLQNADFRRALSLGIDRNELNQTFWLGLGTPGSAAPAEVMPESPGLEWRDKWSTYEPDRANKMLDAIGLAKKDRDGYRLRTDNGQRLVLQIECIAAMLDYPKQMEMVAQHWRKIGIYGDVKQMERGLAFQRIAANQDQIDVWTNGGTELIFMYPRHCLPVDPTEAHLGVEIAKWYSSNGQQGTAPTDPELKRALELFRSAAGQQEAERNKTAQEIWKIIVDQQYSIGTVGQSPAQFGVRIVSRKLGNIPSRVCIAQHCRTPGTSHPETWYFKA